MSVSSVLAFVLLGTRAFTGPRDRAEERPTRTPYEELVAELSEAKARIAELEDDVHRANVQFRRDQELIDLWRERAMQPQAQSLVEQQSRAALQRQAQNMQALQLAQYSAQQAQQAQRAQYAGMGLLGAQNLIDAELWCNCVPSRSQVWAATEPE